MTLGAARLVAEGDGWRIDRVAGPDLAAYVRGRPVAEVAALLPRLFNLCRSAQTAAVHLALDLPQGPDDAAADLIRDHMARLFVLLRQAFDLPPLPVPAASAAVFGPEGQMPRDLAGLARWMALDCPAAELARAVSHDFPAPLGQTPVLPDATAQAGAAENSPALRQQDHPLMRAVEGAQGRTPLWRYLGMLVDLQAAMVGAVPPPRRLPDGTAEVQAARGRYFLRIDRQDGRAKHMVRVTPTDHQLAKGGALDHALRGLPTSRPDLALRLVALFDPCIAVTVAQVHHA